MRRRELLASFDPPLLASEPLTEHEVGAGAVHSDPASGEPLDRLARSPSATAPSLSIARDRAAMPSAQSVPAADVRSWSPPEGRGGEGGPVGPDGCLDQFHQGPARKPRSSCSHALRGRGERRFS